MTEPDVDNTTELHPLLTTELCNQVTKGLGKAGMMLEATNDDWSRLEQILQRYERYARFWAGFPIKGDAQKLLNAGKKAKKLADALTALNEEGYGAIVQNQIEGYDTGALISTLRLLGEINIKSPKTEDDESPSWKAALDQYAAAMQIELDRWWQDVAGEKPTVSEDGSAPYTYFLNQILRCLPGPILGASRTAVEDRRRAFRKWKEKMGEAGRALQGR
jgi:hypothetical protein